MPKKIRILTSLLSPLDIHVQWLSSWIALKHIKQFMLLHIVVLQISTSAKCHEAIWTCLASYLSLIVIISLTNGNVLTSINAYNWVTDSSYCQKYISLYINCYMVSTTKYIHYQIQIVLFAVPKDDWQDEARGNIICTWNLYLIYPYTVFTEINR